MFAPLKACAAFDLWGFGAILFELLTRGSLWHADVDGNLLSEADYAALGGWTDVRARELLDRIPDRWAQARDSVLCMRDSDSHVPDSDSDHP